MDVVPYAGPDGRGLAFAVGGEGTVQLQVTADGQLWWAPGGGEPISPSFATVEEALEYAEEAFSPPPDPGEDPETD